MGLARFTADLLLQWRKLIFLLRDRLKRFGTTRRLAGHLNLGKEGELAAERFLRKQSFKILYRNFRARNGGEIDLVCRDRQEQVLVFVEVKTRKKEIFAPPRDAVNLRKQHQIIKAAKEWLRLLDHPEIPFRFDIVEVVTEPELEIRLIRNAFQLEDNLYV
jgi:putative endonuclease